MRLLIVLLALVFVAFGALFGALNSDWVDIDFYWRTFSVPKGASLLAALLLGWILGGSVIWLLRVPALKRELRRARLRLNGTPPVLPKPPAKGMGGDE